MRSGMNNGPRGPIYSSHYRLGKLGTADLGLTRVLKAVQLAMSAGNFCPTQMAAVVLRGEMVPHALWWPVLRGSWALFVSAFKNIPWLVSWFHNDPQSNFGKSIFCFKSLIAWEKLLLLLFYWTRFDVWHHRKPIKKNLGKNLKQRRLIIQGLLSFSFFFPEG